MTLKKNDLEKMKNALQRYTKEELVDLMQHIIKIYVLDQPVKSNQKLHTPQTLNDFAGLSLQQVIMLLQENLDLEELGKFRVTPTTVFVSIGDMEFDLYGPTPQLKTEKTSEPGEDDEYDEESEFEEDDTITNRPWRTASRKPRQPVVSSVETPSMAELFTDDAKRTERRDEIFSFDPPEAPPPIAENAPGDIVEEAPATDVAGATDFTKTAENREQKTDNPPPPPELASGDRQIDPSNRFASLDLD